MVDLLSQIMSSHSKVAIQTCSEKYALIYLQEDIHHRVIFCIIVGLNSANFVILSRTAIL